THAKTYPASESHEDEAVSIAVDPFDMPDKAAIFKVNYRQSGFLPVRLIVSNDGNGTIMLDELKVEYITADRTKLRPATTNDVYRRLARAGRSPDKPPIQLP